MNNYQFSINNYPLKMDTLNDELKTLEEGLTL
jgi:hypothetical protein